MGKKILYYCLLIIASIFIFAIQVLFITYFDLALWYAIPLCGVLVIYSIYFIRIILKYIIFSSKKNTSNRIKIRKTRLDYKWILLLLTSIAILAILEVYYNNYKRVPDVAKVYIKEEIQNQLDSARNEIKSLFVHQEKDIFPDYHGYPSRFVKGDYKKQTAERFKDIVDPYLDLIPSNVQSYFHVAPEDGIYSNQGIFQTGWALGVRTTNAIYDLDVDDIYVIDYRIIPYAVYYHQGQNGTKEGIVSIDMLLDAAFDFYTQSNDSKFKQYMVSDIDYYFGQCPTIQNKYYYFVTLKKNQAKDYVGITDPDYYADYTRGVNIKNDATVYIKSYNLRVYKLVLDKQHVKNEKELFIKNKKLSIVKYGTLYIGSLFIIWISILVLIVIEKRKRRQTLLQRIIIKCNPKTFLKDYNEEKLLIANEIYSKAIATDAKEDDKIMALATLAEEKLGASFVTKTDIKELMDLCNPKRFMKPYNPQKVASANVIFGKLKKENITCADIAIIKSEIKQLYDNDDVEMPQ